METQATTQAQIIASKRESWAQMGEVVYTQELSLQAMAQAALTDLVLPITIHDVPDAEKNLKALKQSQAQISELRKSITAKFDDVTARLMLPEKSFTEPLKTLSDAIIKVKKEHEAIAAKERAKQIELSRCEAHYSNECIRISQMFTNRVASFVTRCYEKALNDGITPEKVADYIQKSKDAVSDAQFLETAVPFMVSEISQEESLSVYKKHFPINVASYLQKFSAELDHRFSDYAVAFNNKADALRMAQEEEARKVEQAALAAKQAEVANQLQQAALSVSVEPTGTKPLKQAYKVDMPETLDSVLAIMAAFSANINLCLPKLKVNKWFSFTPLQAANTLGKVKTEDNSFAPTGINFKTVDKL